MLKYKKMQFISEGLLKGSIGFLVIFLCTYTDSWDCEVDSIGYLAAWTDFAIFLRPVLIFLSFCALFRSK